MAKSKKIKTFLFVDQFQQMIAHFVGISKTNSFCFRSFFLKLIFHSLARPFQCLRVILQKLTKSITYSLSAAVFEILILSKNFESIFTNDSSFYRILLEKQLLPEKFFAKINISPLGLALLAFTRHIAKNRLSPKYTN